MTAQEHNKLLGIFFMVQGGLQIFACILIVMIYGGFGAVFLAGARKDKEQLIGGIMLVFAVVIGLIILLFAGFYFFTGWKIQKEQPIGRTLGIIASILVLFGFPLGTALGIYGLWFLFGDIGKNFYLSGGSQNRFQNASPPPNNWR